MTNKEKLQPKETFSHAGELGFTIGVSMFDNPYKEEPYRAAWTKGWRNAQKKYAARNPTRPRFKRATLKTSTPTPLTRGQI